jgi:putative membrane protein
MYNKAMTLSILAIVSPASIARLATGVSLRRLCRTGGDMTYLQFHLIFTIPWLILLSWRSYRTLKAGRPLAGGLKAGAQANRFALWALGAHLIIAIIYTTPWDNYLVYRGVWGYPPGRVLFTIGYVPFEEYLFFIFQTALSGLLAYWLARCGVGLKESVVAAPGRLRAVGTLAFLLLAAVGVLLLSSERGTYLGLILVWAMPVLMMQWGFGGDLIVRRWRFVLPAVAIPTVYLWVADWVAIREGIWWISHELTLGWRPLGLPVEEALFFLLTNLFVVFGLTLALHPVSQLRLRELLRYRERFHWWQGALLLWALSMIPTPLIPRAFALLAYLSTGFLALGVFGYLRARYGGRVWTLFGVAFGFGWLVEWLGQRTGVPFGSYQYTAPGPAIAGVPLLVPLGWWAFTIIAMAVTSGRHQRWLAPLALVAWDLGLDPLMVRQGFWRFAGGGVYFGVPLSNFIGWYVAGALLVSLLVRLAPALRYESGAVFKVIFVVQAFLISVGLAFFGLPLAGLVVLLAMGGVVLPFGQRTLSPRLAG